MRMIIKKFWPYILIFILSLLVSWSLFRPGFFPVHDSLQVLRFWQVEKCFLDGQIPCRWTPDLGGGFGFPLFNYYAPLVYYLGMVFRFLGFSFIVILKIFIFLGFISSGISMFLLAREFWGKLGGFVSATLYLFVPYHALNVFVRGDLAEFFALSFAPLVFWSFYRLAITGDNRFFLLASFLLGLFFISHNLTVLIFVPILLMWIIFCFLSKKEFRLKIILAVFLGFGLASFFLLPVWFEKSLVKIEMLKLGYFDFRAHFVTLGQLFLERNWQYGISLFGPKDEMSFQIGWPHWWLAVSVFILAIWKFRRQDFRLKWLIFVSFFVFLFLAFLTHSRSVFLWERLPYLSYLQFPWRFLGPLTFIVSFLGGAIFLFLPEYNKKHLLLLTTIIVSSIVILNFGYFKPQKFLSVSDQDFLSGEKLQKEKMGSIGDFLPVAVKELPAFSSDKPQILAGEASVTEFTRKSDYFKLNFEVFGDNEALVLIPIFNFPDWVVIDEAKIGDNKLPVVENQWGLIMFKIAPGKHEISGWFENSKIRLLGNGLTLASLLLLIFFWSIYNHDKNSRKSS